MPADPPDISVIICTLNRAESLRRTLACLDHADRDGLRAEVLVVDNGSDDDTAEIVQGFPGSLRVRYIREPERGKCHALNRGLDADGLGDIVAFLDDDMETGTDWFVQVKALCDRWPDYDLFSASSYVIWPKESAPGWVHRKGVAIWALSVVDYGDKDRPLRAGEFLMANFWVRSTAIGDLRFDDRWASEPKFMLALGERGCRGICGAKPVMGHRVQPELLHLDNVRRRAWRLGRELPHVRLSFPRTIPQARMAWERPWLWKLQCLANLARWILWYCFVTVRISTDHRVSGQLMATIGIANNLEALLRSGTIVRAARASRDVDAEPRHL